MHLYPRALHSSWVPQTTVGILYTVLACLLYAIAFLRQKHSLHDFADSRLNNFASLKTPVQTVGQAGKRIFGRPFITAGWIVVILTVIVAAVEIGLMVLVCQVWYQHISRNIQHLKSSICSHSPDFVSIRASGRREKYDVRFLRASYYRMRILNCGGALLASSNDPCTRIGSIAESDCPTHEKDRNLP